MTDGRGAARRDPIPWPDSPFLKAVRRAGGDDPFLALALCRADVKRQDPTAYTPAAGDDLHGSSLGGPSMSIGQRSRGATTAERRTTNG